MAGPSPIELLSDCSHCGLESGVVEIYDPLVAACRFGLPKSATCKLCDRTAQGVFDRETKTPLANLPANRCPACHAELEASAVDDRRCAACSAHASLVERTPRAPLATEAELAAALDRWAAREGFASREALAQATFVDADLASLRARIARGERLEVVADPFASMGSATASLPRETKSLPDATKSLPRTTIPKAEPPKLDAAPRSAPPRAIIYPLVSVVSADGEVHPSEREVVDRFLVSEGLAPLTDDEFRVHHPSEVAHFVPKEKRELVVQLMCETAAVDGAPDESEKRVIRAYAAAWDVPDDKVDLWMWAHETASTSLARQLWLKIRRFVLSARWESNR